MCETAALAERDWAHAHKPGSAVCLLCLAASCRLWWCKTSCGTFLYAKWGCLHGTGSGKEQMPTWQLVELIH